MSWGAWRIGPRLCRLFEAHGRESDWGYVSTVRFPFFWLLEGQPCVASFISLEV